MKLSELWLREWVNPPVSSQELARQLTMAGLEVDSVNPVAGEFNQVIVAMVLETTRHPQADKLTLCKVAIGHDKVFKVVCGAANVRQGLKVALALPGAILPGDFIIQETMLRGQLSQGMLCSAAELGIEDSSEGIIELSDDAPLGANLRDYLNLDDQVFDIDLTPNRADCFSVLGIAREVAALNKISLPVLPSKIISPQGHETITINIDAINACPYYCGRVIRGINPDAITPLWLKERLRRGGIRPIHPVVDITNYVMLELGQPMHAFDRSKIDGAAINVRYSYPRERLRLLDGQDLELQDPVLIIADASKPLALAGIMGGEASAVTNESVDIFLESAFFHSLAVAGIARKYGICTDSSQRFERGVDPYLPLLALERATELLQSIVGGVVSPVTVINYPDELPTKRQIQFKPSHVKQLTGIIIAEQEMRSIIENLGMVVSQEGNSWTIDVPSYRFDLSCDVDIVEEVLRLYGYDNLQANPIQATIIPGKLNSYEQLVADISQILSCRGFNEIITYSFIDPQLQQVVYPQKASLELLNPISQELSQMRAGLWPGLIAAMIYNLHRQQTTIRFFESGVVFDVGEHGELAERACIAGLLTGTYGEFNWSEKTRTFDFYDLKGDLQAVFSALGLTDVTFEASSHPALHPGQSARMMRGERMVGWIGMLHPRLMDVLDVSGEVIVFELSLAALASSSIVSYRRISKYPLIRRDLSLVVNCEVTAVQIEGVIREAVDANLLKSFDIFDVYCGESIPQGKKSIAVALSLQDDKRTLVDSEIHAIISAIIRKLENNFAIQLRD
ncbi:MAG: phenylalanine--tRNA ligase subunit beta [Legionella sp.]